MENATPLHLYENVRQAAQRYPDVPIILDRQLVAFPELSLETTYHKVHEWVTYRAGQLASLGIQQGDFVMIYKGQAFDTYLLAVAVAYLGAVPVMVSYHLSAEVLDCFEARLGKVHLLYDDETQVRVQQMHAESRANQWHVKDLLQVDVTKVDSQSYAPNAIAYVTHTSGTTGIPKLICHSVQSMGWRKLWQETVLSKMAERRLCTFHISPVHSRFNIGISSAMSLGFPLMPLASAVLEEVAKALAAYPAYAIETHPNHFVQWRQLAKQQPELFAQTKYFHSTFDAINHQTMADFLKAAKANDPIFLQVYGQSECGPMILKVNTLERLPQAQARDMGIGLGELTRARITNPNGEVLPVGERGHIQLFSRGRALTYYQEDARFDANVYGDWWDSGDYGYMTEAGHLILQDRQVDLVDTLASTLAIEDYLLDQMACLAEVVIIRDPKGYPQPVIALEAGQAMDWAQWWHLVADLPHLNEPMILAYDDIPRTATMKVQRRQLIQQLFEQ